MNIRGSSYNSNDFIYLYFFPEKPQLQPLYLDAQATTQLVSSALFYKFTNHWIFAQNDLG